MGQGDSQEWKGYSHQLLNDKKQRGILIPDSAEKGATKILRHPRAKDGFVGFLKNESKEDLDTAWKLFNTSYTKHGDEQYTGYRGWTDADKNPRARTKYKWMTYKEFGDLAVGYGCGLRELEIADKSNIGIFSLNRPEWYIAHIGNLSQSYRTTALYDTLGADAVSYIVHHAEVPVILTEKSKLKTLFGALSDVKKKCEEEKDSEFKLKYIIQVDFDERYGNTHEKVSDDDRATAKKDFGVELIGFTELIKKGNAAQDAHLNKHLPTKEDIAYIMYTSGTTGDPKGVVLSHQAFAATVGSVSRSCSPSSADVHCSYLPLAHIFEAACQAFLTAQAAKVGYYQGSIKKIGEDWKDLRPTILIGVPRVFNKTYEKFKMKVSKFSSIKQWFITTATESSATNIRKGARNSFYDKYVWDSVGKEIGFDRVRLTVSGAAPLPPHIAEFLRIILPKSAVQQGYGLTETCAVATFADADDLALGHVGPPSDVTEIRLIDAPECGYLTSDSPHPRGEIQIRGLTLMNGYYKNDEATNKVIDKDTKWFSTGDIGRFNPNGTLSIIDRRKNLFKTSTGEYIASEKVEGVYTKSSFINQVWCYGNSFKSFIVAIVVPDAQVLVEKLKENKLWTEDDCKIQVATDEYAKRFKEVCDKNSDLVKKIVFEDMKIYQSELHKFEWIKDIHLECNLDNLLQGFNVDNNLLTPTFKKKRPQLLRHYVDDIKELYTKNGEPPNENENWVSSTKKK